MYPMVHDIQRLAQDVGCGNALFVVDGSRGLWEVEILPCKKCEASVLIELATVKAAREGHRYRSGYL